MSKSFNEQLGDSANKLGLGGIQKRSELEAQPETKHEISLNDKVYLKTGAKILQQYRNPGGTLRQPSIGETVRMGYKDMSSGFIVKQIMEDPIFGKVAEIEPVKYSYQKDQGATYLVLKEDIEI